MTKVLLLGPALNAVSGVSTHLNQLLGSDLSRDFCLKHFQVGSEGHGESRLAAIGRYIFSPLILLYQIILLRPDIVHLNTSIEPKAFWRDLVYLLISKSVGRRVVYQVHGGALPEDFCGGRKLRRIFFNWGLGLPDIVVLLASIEFKAYQEFGIRTPLEVIANAIDTEPYKGYQEKRFNGPGLRLVYIGRLAEDKGIMELIEAMDLIHDTAVTLGIAGSGPFEASLKKKVQILGLQDRVRFLGPLFGKRKLDFWMQAELFVFPTYHREGLPYTILESIASGTPMVTTRVGAIPDVIEDGVHGVLIHGHTPPEVAAAITMLLNDRALLNRMAYAGIKRAKKMYSVDRLAKQFSNVYLKVL